LLSTTFGVGPAQAAAPNSQLVTGAFSNHSVPAGGVVFDRTFPLVQDDAGNAFLASTAGGTGNINIDDFIAVIVTRQNGTQVTVTHAFNTANCSGDIPIAPIPLPTQAGNNVVRIVIADNPGCGPPSGAITPLYIAVKNQPTTMRTTPVILDALPAQPPLADVFVPNLNGKLTETGTSNPIPGRVVVMHAGSASGSVICSAVTDADGVATCGGIVEDVTAILSLGYTAVFSGDAFYNGSSAFGALVQVGGNDILPGGGDGSDSGGGGSNGSA
jgi:hypothetical protein